MNVESLKSELQQVLNNDLVLRKEYAELRRSLGDYRNQLIVRDEDCKRLQVTIDVLNTKLQVLDRDNGNYRTELASLREAQGTLNAELESRLKEIEALVSEAESLREELKTVIAEYEGRLESLREEAGEQVARLQQQFKQEVEQLRISSENNNSGVREEFESRIAAMGEMWADQDRELQAQREEEIQRMRNAHNEEIFLLREQYNNTLSGLSAMSHEQQAELKVKYETMILELEQQLAESRQGVQERYTGELDALRLNSELMRTELTAQFDANLEAMATEYATREQRLRAGYEARITELREEFANSTEELSISMESRVMALKSSHDQLLRENTLAYETKIAELINLYEEKIANLLIHSNASNSMLSEELARVRAESDLTSAVIDGLQSEIHSCNVTITDLTSRIEELQMMVNNEGERLATAGDDISRDYAAELEDKEEELMLLSDELARLNQAHSEYVVDLNGQISTLNEEVQNMTDAFGTMTNDLSAAENALENKNEELNKANARILELEELLSRKQENEQQVGRLLVTDYEQKLAGKDLEFEKLLVENGRLIEEIEDTQRQLEISQSEISLLKTELNELATGGENRVQELKEILEIKNLEITALECSNSNLQKEVEQIKEISVGRDSSREEALQVEIGTLRTLVNELEAKLSVQNPAAISAEQEAFIDKLFKQIDSLNDQRLALLDEKDQMAGQLLKMNEVVGAMSQHVDSESIDVSGLNNHRKNVILASNSGEGGNAPMKKQINELVREIDKCIALLSA
jgi:chromosome segregation ATPase